MDRATGNKYMLAWRLLALHTVLVVSWFGLTLLPSDNPDSSIAFILMVLVGYFIDFPIGMIFEYLIRPIKPDNYPLWFAVSFCWFAILGGAYWFYIGKFISKIRQKRSLHKNNS